MFSVQVDTLEPAVLRAFANMFNELAASSGQTVTVTSINRIDTADLPDTGTEVITTKPQATTTAAAIFGSAAQTLETTSNGVGEIVKDAASVFGATPLTTTAAEVFASPNGQAASLQTASGAAAALDPAPNTNSAPALNVLLDANGLPWDGRIHAGTRTQTQKGEWKKKKGVDDATVASVEAELRAALAVPAKPFTPLNTPNVAPSAPAPSAPPPPQTTAAATQEQVTTTTNAALMTFAELCKYATGRFKAEKILEVCQKHGLPGLGLAAVRTDLIPAIYADLKAAE